MIDHDGDGDGDGALSVGESDIRAMVAAGEIVPNPLEDLLGRVKENVGLAFVPDVLDALYSLREHDRPRYESMLPILRRAGVRIGELEAAMAQRSLIANEYAVIGMSGDGLKGLIDAMTIFRSPTGDVFADIEVDDHRETWLVGSEDFTDHLVRRSFEAYGEPPPKDEINAAVALARARGKFGGEEHAVHLRVAEANGAIYLDLGDREWRAVEISRGGWNIVRTPPVRFIRSPGYRPLPDPEFGGSVSMLRPYVNSAGEDGFQLIVAWLLAALRPGGPYPLLALSGQQGSSKSTLSSLLKSLVDPHAVPLRTSPRDERDLLIAAKSTHLIALDNVSRITPELSDAYCRLSSGGGLTTRKLFTDAAENLLTACRPLLLNGIDEIVTRPDLADRAFFVELATINRGNHRSLDQLQKEFAADLPLILGGVLDVMVFGLRHLDEVADDGLPRMADAARWIIACERALWPPGTFVAALERSAKIAIENLAERTPAVTAIARLMDERGEWQGTATQLLAELSRRLDIATRNSRSLPQTPALLGVLLRGRYGTLLRDLGITVSSGRVGHNRDRLITLRRSQDGDVSATATEPPVAPSGTAK